ncbi:MAG: hypothetical protein EZS28_026215 [Streblomastix strix]|uniref:Uncharacterized protein n=1 Tax=Streblomastix strix TaxID=222440 RepID=A0A5J4V6A6_9EUKA|nr:MAG: hypothetical protein EZS28_026215 [Streblomastix strix]
MKERFVPLIHINCPSYIKCQQCISVVSSASIQQLHIAIFQALVGVFKWGDEQVQVELVTKGYPRILIIIINTAGGNEQEQDDGIGKGLINIADFINAILKGRETGPFNSQHSFPPQPVLFKSCLEQIEDEGGNEEIEAQLVNKGYIIKDEAYDAKESILNIYVQWGNGWQR